MSAIRCCIDSLSVLYIIDASNQKNNIREYYG